MLATVRVTSVYARHGSPWVGSPRGPVRYMFSTVVGSKGTTLALAYGNLLSPSLRTCPVGPAKFALCNGHVRKGGDSTLCLHFVDSGVRNVTEGV